MIQRLLIIALAVSGLALPAMAQESTEFTDNMYGSGKIYVVVAVVAVIFLAIVAYLISLDRRMRKLEDDSDLKIRTE